MQPSVRSLQPGSISSQILGQFLAKVITALLVSWSSPSSVNDINFGDRRTVKHLSLKWVWVEPDLKCSSSKSVWFLRRRDNPLSEKKNIIIRPYWYSQYWTGTSLQWRLMQENTIKKRFYVIYIWEYISLTCKLVPVQYQEYEYGLLLEITNRFEEGYFFLYV